MDHILVGVIVVLVHEEVLGELVEEHALDTEFILVIVGQEPLELLAKILVTLQSLHQLFDKAIRVKLRLRTVQEVLETTVRIVFLARLDVLSALLGAVLSFF